MLAAGTPQKTDEFRQTLLAGISAEDGDVD